MFRIRFIIFCEIYLYKKNENFLVYITTFILNSFGESAANNLMYREESVVNSANFFSSEIYHCFRRVIFVFYKDILNKANIAIGKQ